MSKKIICLIVLITVIFSSCKKDNTDRSIPTIITIDPDEIGSTTASTGGKSVISAAAITQKGVCWSSSNTNPTIADSKTTDGSGNPGYKSVLTGLDPSTTYYVRAYATNQYGTGYGDTKSFTTLDVPELITYYPSGISRTSAICVGEITRTGQAVCDSVGLCWSTSHNPTTKNTMVFMPYQTTFGTFTLTMNNLAPNTTYYVRAFATTSLGTGYGGEVKIRTYYSSATDVDGNVYNTIKIGNQEWMVENLLTTHFRNGASIQALGDFNDWATWTQPAYNGVYDNESFNGLICSRLYNWYATTYSANIAPVGWHVSNSADWQTLVNYLGADSAAYEMKVPVSDYWNNILGDNTSGFSAVAAGYVNPDGSYYGYNISANFWLNESAPQIAMIASNDPVVQINAASSKNYGCSIRCVKD